VNTERVSLDEVDSWGSLAEVDGKVYLLDDASFTVPVLGNVAAGLPLNTTDQAELEGEPLEILTSIFANTTTFGFDLYDPLLSGEADVQFSYNGAASVVRGLAKDPSAIRWVNPSEGYGITNDCLAIPKNAAHPGTAMLFLNWMLDPENQAQNVAFTGYPMGTEAAQEAFAELVAEDPALELSLAELQERADAEEGVQVSRDVGVKGEGVWKDVFEQAKAAA
jgi:spermidine/putrescine transport system substrate-binding protein